MKPRTFLAAVALLAATLPASAHISFKTRDLGSFDGTSAVSVTIDNQTVPNNSGWADGTFPALADSHKVRAFRFTLAAPATITLAVTAHPAATETSLGGLLPAFTLYAGLPHLPPEALDFDRSPITSAWLATLAAPQPKTGAFDALHTFRIGSDAAKPTETGGYDFSSLSTLTFIGYAADGGPANLGEGSGANGDGPADGRATGTWQLPAGSYTVFVGGADHAHREESGSGYGVAVTLKIILPPTTIPTTPAHPPKASIALLTP